MEARTYSLQSNSRSIFIAIYNEIFITSMTYYIYIPMGITGYINSEKLGDCYNNICTCVVYDLWSIVTWDVQIWLIAG